MSSRRPTLFVEPGMFELYCHRSSPTVYPEETHETFQICIPLAGAHYGVVRHSETGSRLEHNLGARDILIVPRQQQHAVHWRKTADIVSLQFSDDFVSQALHADGMRFADARTVRDPLISASAAMLEASLAAGDELPPAVASAFATLLVYRISTHALDHRGRVSTKPVTALSATELRRLDRYIEERLDQAITLADLAACLGMSLWHFSRRFEAAQGATPHAYVASKRLRRAKDLLANSELQVVDIALEVGMTHSHFSRTFLRSFGLTPTEFRRQARTP